MAEAQNHAAKGYSPLTLAFLGDAVLELLVRERITESGSMPVGKLHETAVRYVCASSQAAGAARIFDAFTPEEQELFRRGRNANGNHIPRNASPKDYRAATGLEALFGYLHIQGKADRIYLLFDLFWNAVTQALAEKRG